MTTNYHITKNALEVRVPGTTDIDDCGTMDFHFDLQRLQNFWFSNSYFPNFLFVFIVYIGILYPFGAITKL